MILALSTCLTACRDSGEPPLVAEDILRLNSEANQVAIGLKHYVTSEGIRRAYVEADTAFFIESKGLVELSVLQVTFFNGIGDTTSVLTSSEGTYDWNTGDMTATENVVVVNPRKGRRVETSVLYYNRSEDRIWSDAATKMFEADGTVVEGTAFESNSGMEQVNLTSARAVSPGARQQPVQ